MRRYSSCGLGVWRNRCQERSGDRAIQAGSYVRRGDRHLCFPTQADHSGRAYHVAAGRLKLVVDTAESINSLGDVSWGRPEMMLRSNFRTCQETRPYGLNRPPAGYT
jgi:hypothetical protein